MESSSQKSPNPPEDDLSIRSPVLRLLLVSDKGMVFESNTSFAIGCSVELAVHVQSQRGNHRRASRPPGARSELITSEGVVVCCAPHAPSAVDGSPVFEVTLLFSSVRTQDRRKLKHLANRYRQPVANPSMTASGQSGHDCLGLN